jgi:2-amino-4-hydroxy-6-hydroxymethyldihydropteridine diphosphokinase
MTNQSRNRVSSNHTPAPVAIALGSNLGDREQNLRKAAERLGAAVSDLQLSSIYETEPEGVGAQPKFLNAAAVGNTHLAPDVLLAELLAIERALGRERPYSGAPRTVDLDLILYDGAVIEGPSLTLPHPRFRDRRFVLAPLAEIAPEWVDPVSGRTIRGLLEALG